MTSTYKNILYILLLGILAFFSFLMLRILFIYIPLQNDAGFLQLKQSYIENGPWRMAFYTHVFSSILVLFAGFTHFSKKFMHKYAGLHRVLGYIYVIDILMITGPASLLMSFYANGGISSRIAFVLLAILWLGTTATALYYAIKKNFTAHRNFMIRSFALTLSAITLRSWKMVLVYYTDLPPMDRYRIIAWLGWTLNLLIAEILIRYVINKRSRY